MYVCGCRQSSIALRPDRCDARCSATALIALKSLDYVHEEEEKGRERREEKNDDRQKKRAKIKGRSRINRETIWKMGKTFQKKNSLIGIVVLQM